MSYKFFLLTISLFLLIGCNQNAQIKKPIKLTTEQKYRNTGFALIYNSFLILSFKVQTANANLKDRFHFKIIS